MCRHEPSLRERDDVKPRKVGACGLATAHDCVKCGAICYRVHSQPDLKAVARYNATGSTGPNPVSKTEKRDETLRLLRDLPHAERAARRIRLDEVEAA
jgi:hypothetical protein